MYISCYRKKILEKTGASTPDMRSVPPRATKRPQDHTKGPIPIDGRSYLTDEGRGRFVIWDLHDIPAAIPLVQVNREIADAILRHTKKGKKILREIYQSHEIRMKEQRMLSV